MAKGTNLNLLKKKVEEAQSRRNLFWRPKDDEHLIRIIPNPDENKLFFVESAYHVLDGTFYNCPEYAGEKCPICAKTRKLYKGTDEEQATAANIKAVRQYYYNAILRAEPFLKDADGKESDTPAIKLCQVGSQIHDKVTSAMLNNEIGDITDVEDGYDLKIIKKMKGRWNNWESTEVVRTKSPLFEDKSKVEYCLSHYKDPNEFIKYPDVSELARAVEEYLTTGVVSNPTGANQPKSESSSEKSSSEEEELYSKEEKEEPKEEKAAPKEEKSESAPKEEKSESTDSKDEFDQWEKEFDSDFAE